MADWVKNEQYRVGDRFVTKGVSGIPDGEHVITRAVTTLGPIHPLCRHGRPLDLGPGPHHPPYCLECDYEPDEDEYEPWSAW